MSARTGVIALLFAVIAFAPFGAGNAHAATTEEMYNTIKSLLAQIETLQKQLNTIRGEVKVVLRDGLKEGMTSEDIGKLQQLLATDSTIYPEGRVTKFFGPLTKEAVKRFQARHELEVTGEVDGETHALLEEYLKEGFGDNIPPGLLRAPGIMKKVQLRFEFGCEHKGKGGGMGPLCKKLKVDHDEDEDEEEEDEDEDSDDSFDVEAEIEDGETTVSFTFEDEEFEVTVDGTDTDDVLDAVAEELDEEVADLDEDLVDAITEELEDAVDEYNDFEVEVEVENGSTTVEFTYGGEDYDVEVDSTDEDDVLEAIADEMDEDVDDLDEEFVDMVTEALDDAEDSEVENDAQDALDDAEDAIDAAQDAIEDADGDTDAAEVLLDDAENKLEDAELAFDGEDFEDAISLANEAEDLADDAVAAL